MTGELKKAGVPVVVHPTMQRAGGSMETIHSYVGNAALLADAGVPIAICTGFEGYVPKTRVLRHEAAMAAANGLGHERALRAVTIDAARLLGVAAKYGSIEKGTVPDLVRYDGDPFERRILPLLGAGGGAGCCMGLW